MRAFDWLALLRERGINYVDRGPNVKRGELNIRCPWCGSADPSHHLGLNLETGWYACWRNSSHRGKSPVRLLMQLLRASYGEAREIAGLGDDYVDPEGFDAVAARLLGRMRGEVKKAPERPLYLELPREFLIIDGSVGTRRFWNYLYDRGFASRDIELLCQTYCLRACRTGRFGGRVIFPFLVGGHVVTWTGRAIGPSTARYLDLSLDESVAGPKHTLYNHDSAAQGGRVLVLQEGPVDAVKVDFYGREFGVRSVGLSTNTVSDDQSYLLQELADGFDRVLVMMDQATPLGIIDSMRMRQRLSFIGDRMEIAQVPFGAKDGGALTPEQVCAWAAAITATRRRRIHA